MRQGGTTDLVAHLAARSVACRGRFVLVGYSQGAAVVQTALGSGATTGIPGATRLTGALASRVVAADFTASRL